MSIDYTRTKEDLVALADFLYDPEAYRREMNMILTYGFIITMAPLFVSRGDVEPSTKRYA